jgi:selenium metabolism protein YedF
MHCVFSVVGPTGPGHSLNARAFNLVKSARLGATHERGERLMELDAMGKQCPQPLVMAKKEINGGNREFSIRVDNETALKNLTRLGTKEGLVVGSEGIEGGFRVSFSAEGTGMAQGGDESVQPVPLDISPVVASRAGTYSGYSVFVNKDHVGDGDPTLGHNLIKMALYTLSEVDDVPVAILFMNSGVKLLVEEETQIVDSLAKLIEKGTEVLACGACLDFYGLKERLAVGEISNMYDILERMREAGKVITL